MSTALALRDAAARLVARPVTAAPPLLGRLAACEGGLLHVAGLDAAIGDICAIARAAAARPGRDRGLLAEVIGFRGERLMLMPFGDAADLKPGAHVHVHGGGALAPVGEALMGRVVDGLCRPADGLGPVRASAALPLTGTAAGPLERSSVRTAIATGVRAIDAVLTLGRGQRVGLIAGSGVGKSVLMGMIARAADADAIVVGLVGERGREIADFLETKLPADARARATVVAAPADQSPALRIRAAQQATAIAEWHRAQGRHCLLLMDSLTRVAHAQREIGLALGEPASARGYPPSAIAMIGRLCERAGGSATTGGAVTAIYTVLADGDDGQDPVVDAARAILDGHVVLDRGLAERGHYPAIHPARSLSRCMADIVDEPQLAAARALRRHFAVYEENRDLFAMGAWKSGQDAELDAAVAAYPQVLRYLAQPLGEIAAAAESVARLLRSFR